MFAMECEICNENVKYGEDYIKHLQDEHKANPQFVKTAQKRALRKLSKRSETEMYSETVKSSQANCRDVCQGSNTTQQKTSQKTISWKEKIKSWFQPDAQKFCSPPVATRCSSCPRCARSLLFFPSSHCSAVCCTSTQCNQFNDC